MMPAHDTSWRPLAHVAVSDEELRSQIAGALGAGGWAVLESPSGYHLLQSIAGLLLDSAPWRRPNLLVADAFSPGCSGLSIARGLSELGWSTPAVLLVSSPEQAARIATDPNDSIVVADRAHAVPAVLDFARRGSSRPVTGKEDIEQARAAAS